MEEDMVVFSQKALVAAVRASIGLGRVDIVWRSESGKGEMCFRLSGGPRDTGLATRIARTPAGVWK